MSSTMRAARRPHAARAWWRVDVERRRDRGTRLRLATAGRSTRSAAEVDGRLRRARPSWHGGDQSGVGASADWPGISQVEAGAAGRPPGRSTAPQSADDQARRSPTRRAARR
ncbi:MAG: hypothetical protein V9F04_13790 [Dermatophilaceae bacterium]